MTLKQLTKAELIEIIQKNIDPWRVQRILDRIHQQRELAEYDKADKLAVEGQKHYQAYMDFVKKYEGKLVTSIPKDERDAAVKHLAEYQRLDEEWRKIMMKEVEP